MSTAVQIVNKSHHPLPEYATTGSSGMDIRAFLNSPISMAPMSRILIPTGLFLALPENWEAQIRPRSGLAIKQGLTCLNTPGTIDADYRGEIKVPIINLGDKDFIVERGMRIAQLIIARYEKIEWNLVEQLPQNTTRGDAGFGSTGLVSK
jgi:dUTP pyrophosphatase